NRAMELLMTGNMLSANEALTLGIVNKILPADDLLQATKDTLALINSKAPMAIARIIQSVNAFDHTQAGFDLEIEKFAECFNTADMKEGISAFLEKRKANFTGK
ncbi:MAG TPA: enoyl-CoA hydratase-related protein, partial [Chitinophagaceae bacterium]